MRRPNLLPFCFEQLAQYAVSSFFCSRSRPRWVIYERPRHLASLARRQKKRESTLPSLSYSYGSSHTSSYIHTQKKKQKKRKEENRKKSKRNKLCHCIPSSKLPPFHFQLFRFFFFLLLRWWGPPPPVCGLGIPPLPPNFVCPRCGVGPLFPSNRRNFKCVHVHFEGQRSRIPRSKSFINLPPPLGHYKSTSRAQKNKHTRK